MVLLEYIGLIDEWSTETREMEEMMVVLDKEELLGCCGSTKFAKEMASASPFASLNQAVSAARHIWFNLVLTFVISLFFAQILSLPPLIYVKF